MRPWPQFEMESFPVDHSPRRALIVFAGSFAHSLSTGVLSVRCCSRVHSNFSTHIPCNSFSVDPRVVGWWFSFFMISFVANDSSCVFSLCAHAFSNRGLRPGLSILASHLPCGAHFPTCPTAFEHLGSSSGLEPRWSTLTWRWKKCPNSSDVQRFEVDVPDESVFSSWPTVHTSRNNRRVLPCQ